MSDAFMKITIGQLKTLIFEVSVSRLFLRIVSPSGGVGDAKVMSSEVLQIVPGRKMGRIALVWVDPNRDLEDVVREFDELTQALG